MTRLYVIRCDMPEGGTRLLPDFEGGRLSDNPAIWAGRAAAKAAALRLRLKEGRYRIEPASFDVIAAPLRKRWSPYS